MSNKNQFKIFESDLLKDEDAILYLTKRQQKLLEDLQSELRSLDKFKVLVETHGCFGDLFLEEFGIKHFSVDEVKRITMMRRTYAYCHCLSLLYSKGERRALPHRIISKASAIVDLENILQYAKVKLIKLQVRSGKIEILRVGYEPNVNEYLIDVPFASNIAKAEILSDQHLMWTLDDLAPEKVEKEIDNIVNGIKHLCCRFDHKSAFIKDFGFEFNQLGEILRILLKISTGFRMYAYFSGAKPGLGVIERGTLLNILNENAHVPKDVCNRIISCLELTSEKLLQFSHPSFLDFDTAPRTTMNFLPVYNWLYYYPISTFEYKEANRCILNSSTLQAFLWILDYNLYSISQKVKSVNLRKSIEKLKHRDSKLFQENCKNMFYSSGFRFAKTISKLNGNRLPCGDIDVLAFSDKLVLVVDTKSLSIPHWRLKSLVSRGLEHGKLRKYEEQILNKVKWLMAGGLFQILDDRKKELKDVKVNPASLRAIIPIIITREPELWSRKLSVPFIYQGTLTHVLNQILKLEQKEDFKLKEQIVINGWSFSVFHVF